MSKKKNNKREMQLSPENYIRQRARNLPIYQCWINTKWQIARSAIIFVVRKHASGNVTYCMYGVDLLCCGVTLSLYAYNESEEDFKKILENSVENCMDFEQTQYDLVHNIIYAAIEFAEEYGFKPASEFTQVTQYLLEEDNENIPLIDIHCGDDNGKPLYVNAGEDSPAKEKQILAQLDKTAGPGNYNYLLHDDIEKDDNDDDDFYDNFYDDDDDDIYDFDDDDFDDDDDDEEDEEYDDDDFDDDEDYEYEKKLKKFFRALGEEKLKTRFIKLVNKVDEGRHINRRKHIELIEIVNYIIKNSIEDIYKCTNYVEEFKKVFDCNVIDIFEFPNSFFAGLKTDDFDKVVELYDEIENTLLDSNRFEKAIERFQEEFGKIPLLYFFELLRMNTQNDISQEKYTVMLEEYYRKYPDYLLLKILYYANLGKDEEFKTILSSRKEPVTQKEMSIFSFSFVKCELQEDDRTVEKIEALDYVLKYLYHKNNIDVQAAVVYLLFIKIEMAKQICEYNEWLKNNENNETVGNQDGDANL